MPALLAQAGQDVVQVADQLDLGHEVGVDLGREGVDADDRLVAVRVPVLRRMLHEVVADRDHQIRDLEPGHPVVARLEPDRTKRLGVAGVHRALAHERLRDGDPGGAYELAQRRRGAAADHAIARERHRVERSADQVRRLQKLARGGLGLNGFATRDGNRVEITRHHVLGQLDVRGTGLLRLRDLEGLADDLGDDVRVRDLGVPLGDRLHHANDVDVLVRLLVHALEVALASQRDQRRAVQIGVGHGRHEVRGPRPERPQAHARAAREPPVHVRHVGPALLVPHRDELDRRVRQRLVQVERLLPGDAEYVLDALGLQAVNEDVRCSAGGHALTLPTAATVKRCAESRA